MTTASNTLRLVRPVPQPIPYARSIPPSGLLALMVTDLEGFTGLVDSLGDVEARALIREHNLIVRSCIRRRSGHEVAHTGDGFITAFRSVVAAIECARDLQAALARELPLRARIGIHAGEPLQEEERLFGQCVNTAVRVCAAAQPGRVLVTDVVKQLARGRFSFGPGTLHGLKGLSQPIVLHDFVAAEHSRVDAAVDQQ